MKSHPLSFLPPVFDYWQLCYFLKNYQGIREKIANLIKEGEILRVKKGLYVLGEHYQKPYDLLALANLIYGPSYVSSLSALSFYGAIPERVEEIHSMDCKKLKKFETPVGRFIYHPLLPMEDYRLGITFIENSEKKKIIFATKEKSILDLLLIEKIYEKKDMEIFFDDIRLNRHYLLDLDLKKLRDFEKTTLNRNKIISNFISYLRSFKNV
ncbi:MAG: hypothetical protein HQK53_13905 [Oligoflexia bacterium]|nr:hypothetical protein [Oligoflexia bacterium]